MTAKNKTKVDFPNQQESLKTNKKGTNLFSDIYFFSSPSI